MSHKGGDVLDERLEILDRILRRGATKEKADLEALAYIASIRKTKSKGGKGMPKQVEKETRKGNFEKYGVVVEEKRIKDLAEYAEEGCKYEYFVLENATGELRHMPHENGVGTIVLTYHQSREKEEAPAPAKKPTKKPSKPKYTAEEVMELSRKKLERLIDDEDLDIDASKKKYKDTGVLQDAVLEALGLEKAEKEISEEDIDEMDRDTLEELIDMNELAVDVEKYSDSPKGLKKLKAAVKAALFPSEEEEEDDE